MEKSGWIIYHDGEISDQIKEKEIIGEIGQKLLRLDELKGMWLSYSEKKQLVLYIDGLGWHQLKESLSQCPYFSSFNTTCALSSWPPITNTALASMLSGVDASVHQIKSHAERSLKLSTIFDEYPGRCVYIEGERTILHTQQSALLNPRDENDSDQAVLSCMQTNLDHDFIFVHIHGYDDVCHHYSPQSRQAIDKLIWLDGRLSQLLSDVKGMIWLISDHGQHANENKGEHGSFCEADMLVPIGLRVNENE